MIKYKYTLEIELDDETHIEYLKRSLTCLVMEWVENQEPNGVVGGKNWMPTGNFYKIGECQNG